MSWSENRHNREKAGKYRAGMITAIMLCVMMALVLAGILLNNHKNDIRLEGISLYEQGMYEDAIVKLTEGIQTWAPFSGPLKMDMYWYEGSCYLMLGDYINAKAVYETMLAESSGRTTAGQETEGQTAGGQETEGQTTGGQAAEGQTTGGQAAEGQTAVSDRVLTYQQIAAGLTAYMEKDYEQAAQGLAEYAGKDCPALYLYLGSCYLELSRIDEMQQAFQAYRELGLDSDFLHAELASYYIGIEDYHAAQTEVAAGLALSGSYAKELRWQEICCLEFLWDYNGAYEKMRSYSQDYALDEAEQKEWDFLQTVETSSEKVAIEYNEEPR